MRIPLFVVMLARIAVCAPVAEETVEHAGAHFRVVRASPARVRVVWKDENGNPFRTFQRVQDQFGKQGRPVVFIMNGGIFETGGTPCGLHVENCKTLHGINQADAPGNFFLKPNGVAWIEEVNGARHAFVATTQAFMRHMPAARIENAIQSGPMLIMDGKRHPAFKEGSPNRLHRNGVGVDQGNRLVFAITNRGQAVNLWDFAGLFLTLGCKNALFLDGDISQMAVNPDKPVESNLFGAMFVITE